jgi:hypothetical protein
MDYPSGQVNAAKGVRARKKESKRLRSHQQIMPTILI